MSFTLNLEKMEGFLDSDKKGAQISRVILVTLALGGIILTVGVAPNIFQIFGKNKSGKKYSKLQYKNSFQYLKRNGHISVSKNRDDKIEIKLTDKGHSQIKKFRLEKLEIPKPKNWDGKWHVLIFDVPNTNTSARRALQEKVKELGLRQLQKSVWIYPYKFEDEIVFIANLFGIDKYVEILTVEKILHGQRIEKYFSKILS